MNRIFTATPKIDAGHQRVEKPILQPFVGHHLLAECFGISPDILNDEAALSKILVDAIAATGAVLLGLQSKQFYPHGITLLALLAESHASMHTYPDRQAIFLDIFTCGNLHPLPAFDHIVHRLEPQHFKVNIIKRGEAAPVSTAGGHS